MPPRYNGMLESAKASIALYVASDPNREHLMTAQSAAYYALFHAVAQHCADVIIPNIESEPPRVAWLRFYRALNHSVFNRGAMTSHKA